MDWFMYLADSKASHAILSKHHEKISLSQRMDMISASIALESHATGI
jgi:hypothetical protein